MRQPPNDWNWFLSLITIAPPAKKRRRKRNAARSATLQQLESRELLTASLQVFNGSSQLSSGTYDSFGTAGMGSSDMQNLTLKNVGDATLTINSDSVPYGFYASTSLPLNISPGQSTTFTLGMNTNSMGSFGGQFSMSSNDPNNSNFSLSLSGSVQQGSGGGSLELFDGNSQLSNGASDSLGSVTVGSSDSRNFLVENVGSGTLTVNSLTLPNGFYTSNSFPLSVGAGQSTTLVVAMYTSAAGQFNGTMSLSSNDVHSPFQITLSGTVTSPSAPSMTLRDGSVTLSNGSNDSFGSVAEGSTSSKVFSVSNSGNANLTITSIALPGGFSLAAGTSLPLTVTPGNSGTFTVTMNTSSVTSYSGQMTLQDNDSADSPFNVSLTGTVTAPPEPYMALEQGSTAVPNGGSYSFGSVTVGASSSANFQITNSGSGPLTISSIALPSGFSSSLSAPLTISPNSSTGFTVTMTTAAAATLSGQLVLRDNDGTDNNDPYTVNLSGTVVVPPAPSMQVSLGSATLSNGGSVNFGTATIGSIDTQPLSISNNGNATLNVTSLTLPSGFTSTASLPLSIAPGQSAPLVVSLDTSSAANDFGQLSIGDDDQQNNPFTLTLSGTVTLPPPVLSLYDGSTAIDNGSGSDSFGTTVLGSPIDRTLTIDNSGSTAISLTPGSLELPAGFSLQGTFPTSVPANGSATFVVQLDATHQGNEQGQAQFSDADPGGGTYRFGLTGMVTAPDMQLTANQRAMANGDSFAFGTLKIGANATANFQITNAGTGPLTITSFALPSGFSSPLAASLPITVNPGSSTGFSVIMDTARADTFSGQMVFRDNDSSDNTDPYVVKLSGTVTATGVITSVPEDVSIFASASPTPAADGATEIDLSGSYQDPADNLTNNLIVIDWGDGVTEGFYGTANQPFGPLSHVYAAAAFTADYLITVTVTAAGGASASASTTVVIAGTSGNYGYGSGYGGEYDSGSNYGTGYGSDYGAGYGSGYGSGFGAGYGSDYATGYGAGYGSGYSDGVIESITLSTPQATAYESSGTPATLSITRSTPDGYTTDTRWIGLELDGTATLGADFTLQGDWWYSVGDDPSEIMVYLPAGVDTVTLDIVPVNHGIAGDADKILMFSVPSLTQNYVLADDTPPVITIVDDNVPDVTLQATQSPADALTGATGTFTVTRYATETYVPLATSYSVAGTAEAGIDYVPLSGAVTIPSSSCTATITVTPIDNGPLNTERSSLVLPAASGETYTLSLGGETTQPLACNAVATDVESALEALPNVGEGNVLVAGWGTVQSPFVIVFKGTLAYTTLPQLTADATGLVGAAGSIVVLSSAVTNPTVQLDLLSDGYDTMFPWSDSVSIVENFPPQVSLAATQSTADELTGSHGTFTITRRGPDGTPLAVTLAVSGDATNYQLQGATLNSAQATATVLIPAGQATATIDVVPINDGQPGPNETVTLSIVSPNNGSYNPARPTADTVTIDEDAPPEVNIQATQSAADEVSGTPGIFTVTRNGPTNAPLVVDYTASGTATNFASLPGSVTIPAGQSSAAIDIDPLNANLAGPNQSVILTLSPPADGSYADGAQASDAVVIVEDAPPAVSIQATTSTVDVETGSPGEFTVTRNSGLENDLTVEYAIGGTAVSGEQFQQLSGSVVIPTGEASAIIDILPIDTGQTFQPSEYPTVTLTLASGDGTYTAVSPTSDTVTINEDAGATTSDGSPAVTIAATQNVAYEPTGLAGVFTVTRSGPTDAPLIVQYAVAGSAAGAAYESLSGYVTVPIGSSTAAITVFPVALGQAFQPGDAGTVVVTLDAAGDGSYSVGSQWNDTVTIEGPPTATVGATQPDANEQTGQAAALTVSLDQTAVVPVAIAYTVGGSAVSGVDFLPLSGTITVSAGASSATIPVTPKNAHHSSGTENLVVTLSASAEGTYLVGSPDSGTAVIQNLAPPTIAVQATTPDASLPGNTAGAFTVARSGDTSGAVTVPLTVGGTAVSGVDYQPIATSVSFQPGQTSATIAVTPVSTDYFTGNRTVSLTLGAPSDQSYQLGPAASATVSISGDALPLVSMVATQSTASVPANQSATVTLTRTGPTTDPLTIGLSTSGPAVNGADYQLSGVDQPPSAGTVTIPAGSSSTTLIVTGMNNGQYLTTADFSLTSSGDYNFGTSATAVVTIVEQLPTITIQATQKTADAPSGTLGAFTVTRSGPTTTALTVYVSVSGTAVSGTDFQPIGSTVTIAAGASSATVAVRPIVDTSGANTESVVLTLDSSSNYSVGAPSSDTVTIDQDLVPAIEVFDGSTLIPAGSGSDDFGSTPQNVSALKTFTIVNTGTITVSIYGSSFTLPTGFGLYTPPPSSLAPGASGSFVIEFAPAAVGSDSGVISFGDSDQVDNPYTFQVTATGAPAQPQDVAIDNFGLADDTGASSTDRVTSDPTVAGTIDGFFLGGWAVVDFNDNGNAAGSTAQISASGTTFTYDARQDDPSLAGCTGPYDLQYRLLLYDAGGNLASTGPWNDFSMTIVAPETAPYVADFGLANDTGGVDQTGVRDTYDPRVTGVIQGIAAGDSVDVQFDHNGDLTPFASAPGISTSRANITYDPSVTDPSLIGYSGPLTLDYRVVEHDSSGNVVYTSGWMAFSMTLYVPTPTVTVDNLQLADDTDPSSLTPASADPTLSGQVDGTLLAGGALVQFSNRGNGTVDGGVTISQPGQSFKYDPRTTDSSLTQFVGSLPLAYRVAEFDGNGGTMYGPWTSFPITIEAAPSATTIQNVQLVNPTISQSPPVTSNPTISGTVVGGPGFALVTVQVYYNDDTAPNQSFYGSYNQTFSEKLSGLPYGQNTLHLRTVETPWGSNYPLYGSWTTFNFDYEPPPPPTISLSVSGETQTGTTTNPQIIGMLTGGASDANVLVEFHGSPNGPIIGEATSSVSGIVSFTPIGLNLGPVTIDARSAVPDPLGGLSYGAWSSVSFTYVGHPGAAPAITNLVLAGAPPAGTSSTSSGSPTVSDATITGQVTKSDGRVDFQTVDFYYNNDTSVDGTAITAADGTFTFTPKNLPAGPVTINAQASVWDDASQTYLTSAVASVSLIYQPPTTAGATIASLGLVNDLGTDGNHAASDPTLTGQVSAGTGNVSSAALLTVEFDTNDDGTPDASAMTDAGGQFQFTPSGLAYGPVTIQARVAQYDYATGGTTDSAWFPFTFTYQAPQITAPALTSFGMASVTGAPASDGTPTTANPSTRGQVNVPTDASNLVVEFFVNGQTTPAGYASPDAQGNFIYTPSNVAYGTVAITANLVQWDAAQNAYVVRDSKQVSFIYDQEPDAAPAFASASLVDAEGQFIAALAGPSVVAGSPDPVTTAPVIAGQLSYQGSLQGLSVQFDTTGGTTPNASVTTDQYGEFSFTPVGLAYGTVTINARTQVLDANTHQLLTGPWTPLTFTYQQPPTATLTVGSFQLASSSTDSSGNVTASDPTVTGTVEDGLPSPSSQTSDGPGGPSSLADLTVQIQVNGAIVGTTLTDSQGNFSYTPSGLAAGQSVTIEARALHTDASGSTVDGTWSTPITFALSSADTSTMVSQLQLVNGSGSPVTSLLTSNPIVAGQISSGGALSGLPLSGITVELDTNGDGQADQTTTTNSNGQFTFWPTGLPQGVVVVSARTSTTTASDGTTTTSAWTSLKFVYTTTPSDPTMQSLAAALVAQANSAASSEASYEAGQASAASALQESLSAAPSAQSSGDAAATATYNSAAAAAGSTYASQATAAESNFATALQSYQGDTTSYSVQDFSWPTPPPAAQLPDDPQPAPPVQPPSDTGPTFDVTQDPGYQSAVAAAQAVHDASVQTANANYQAEVAADNAAYDASLTTAASQEEQILVAAANAQQAATAATNPYDVVAALAAYNQTIAGLTADAAQKDTTYKNVFNAASYAAQAAETATCMADLNAFDTTFYAALAAWNAYFQPGPEPNNNILAWLARPDKEPIFSHLAAFCLAEEQAYVTRGTGDDAAIEKYTADIAAATDQQSESVASAVYQNATAASAAGFALSQIQAQAAAWLATSGANAAYADAMLTDAARQAFSAAQAQAQQQLEDSLAQAARDRTSANADAESTLNQSIANAAAAATASWAAEQGTPSAQYQATLAEDQAQFVARDAPAQDQLLHSQADADFAKAQALDQAGEQQAEAAAAAAQTLADATAASAKGWALGSAAATESAAMTDATALLTERDAVASANLAESLVYDQAEKTWAIAVAKAAQILNDAVWQDGLNALTASIAAHHDGDLWAPPPAKTTATPSELQAYAVAVAPAANARDHAELPAYLAQEVAIATADETYADATRNAAAGLTETLTTLKSTQADQIAQAQHDNAVSLAQAQHDLETSTAQADALDVSLSAAADQTFGDALPGFQQTQDIADAQALEQFETGPLDFYASELQSWAAQEGSGFSGQGSGGDGSSTVGAGSPNVGAGSPDPANVGAGSPDPAPWASEQAAFAAADATLAAATSAANIAHITAIDAANIAWTEASDAAMAARADGDAAAAVTAETAIADAQLTEAQSLADAQLARMQSLDAANSSEQNANGGAGNAAADTIADAATTLQIAKDTDLEVEELAVSDINLKTTEGNETASQAATDTENAQNAQAAADAAALAAYQSTLKTANQNVRSTADAQVSTWSDSMADADKAFAEASADSQATLTGALADANAGLAAAEAQGLSTEQLAQAQADADQANADAEADQTQADANAVADAANTIAYAQAEGNYSVGRANWFASQLSAAAASGDPLVVLQAAIAAAQATRALSDAAALVAKETAVTDAEVAAGDQQQADQVALVAAEQADHVTLVEAEAPAEAQETADQATAEALAAQADANAAAAQSIADSAAAIDDQNAVTQAIVQNDENVAAGQSSQSNPASVTTAANNEKQAVNSAAVAFATGEGDAEVTLATSLATAANTLASTEETAEDQSADADEAALVSQQNQDAQASEAETASIGQAEAAYQLSLGANAVTYATTAAGAEADFAVKGSGFGVQGSGNVGPSDVGPGSPDPAQLAAFQAVYAQAYVNWLTDTRSAYIAHATVLAQDEADDEEQLAVDQENLANTEAADAVNATAAQGALDATRVDGEAANDNAYSAALVADQGQEAVSLAEADQTQQVTLASIQANPATQAYAIAAGAANLAWVQSVAAGEAQAADNDAVAQNADATGDAMLEDAAAKGDAADVDTQTRADASAEAAQAENDVTADAARQTADAAADVVFNTALDNETANQWSSLVAWASPTAANPDGLPGLPWIQFRAGLATAVAAWYTASSGTYTALVGAQTAAEIAYSLTDGNLYLTEADNVADDQSAEAATLADAAQAAADAISGDQLAYVQAMSAAWSTEQTGVVQANYNYTVSGNWSAMNTALAGVNSAWVTGQSTAIANQEISDAAAALAQNTADLNAAESEQEGSPTAELPQIQQYDDAESAAYDAEQKADDVAESVRIQADAASYAAAIASFAASVGNALSGVPNPWADEAAALAAAASTQAASLAAAQQTESDTLADDEKQAEITETDAQTQFQESQVANEQTLEQSQATNADNEINTNAQVLETGAATNPQFTALPAALAPPAAPAAPAVPGGRYYPYTSVTQLGGLSIYPATPTPGVSFDAANNFYSWLGWNPSSAAGGSASLESPNLSTTLGSLADAAFTALGLLQTDVQASDSAVRADDSATNADGSKMLPPLDTSPPALTPPGTPQLPAAPSTPPTPMAFEGKADAPPPAPTNSTNNSPGGNQTNGNSATQPSNNGSITADDIIPDDFNNPNNEGITDRFLSLRGTPFVSALDEATQGGGVFLVTLISGRKEGFTPGVPGPSYGKDYIEQPIPSDRQLSWPAAMAIDIGVLVDEGRLTVEQGRDAFDRLGTWLKANGWIASPDGLSFTKNNETITRPTELAERPTQSTADSTSDKARIRFSTDPVDGPSAVESPLPVSVEAELGDSAGSASSYWPMRNSSSTAGLELRVVGELGFTPWMSKPTLFGYDVSGMLTDEQSTLLRFSTLGASSQRSIFDSPPPSAGTPSVVDITPEQFMAIDAGMKTTVHAAVLVGGTFVIVEGGGALVPGSISRLAAVQTGKQVAGRLLIWYGTAEGAKLTIEGGNTLLLNPDASQQERYAAYEKLYAGVPSFVLTARTTAGDLVEYFAILDRQSRVLGVLPGSGTRLFFEGFDPRTRPWYDPAEIQEDHTIAEVFGGTQTRPVPAGMNLRKGGLEGELRKYELYLIENGMTKTDARAVIAAEIESLSRDVIAAPFSRVFKEGFTIYDLEE